MVTRGNPQNPPYYSIDPTHIRFGPRVIGGEYAQVVEITNLISSSDSRDGFNIRYSYPCLNCQFEVRLEGLRNGLLYPGETARLVVIFRPQMVPGEGTSIDLNMGNGLRLDQVNISGSGVHSRAIVVSPTSVNFGNVLVGSRKTSSIHISNQGAEMLSIHDIQINNPQFTHHPNITEIGPGNTETLMVTYAPTDEGSVNNAMLTISSDDTINHSLEIPLSGEGIVEPRIKIMPNSLHFGTISAPKSHSVFITNEGNEDLVVNPTVHSYPNDVYSMENSGSVTVPPSQTKKIKITAKPPISGWGLPVNPTGNFIVISNDPNNNEVTELKDERIFVPLIGKVDIDPDNAEERIRRALMDLIFEGTKFNYKDFIMELASLIDSQRNKDDNGSG